MARHTIAGTFAKIVLASALVASVPTLAFADEVEGFFGDMSSVSDGGCGEPAESWRFKEGYPESLLLELSEESGIVPYGAFSDVGDSYRATWSQANGVGKYVYRRTPTEAGTIITAPGVREVGIDVSYYNNEKRGTYSAIDWAQVKSDGITFAIIRCGDGPTFDDPWFARNVKGAKEQGIKVGVYLYARAQKLTGEGKSVQNEVAHTLRQLSNAGLTPADLDLPVYYDMEDKSQRVLDSALLGQIAKAYCDGMQSAGYSVGIYSNPDWFSNVLVDPVFTSENMKRAGWSRWVARYSWGSSSSGVEATDIWQFTSIGLVNGTPAKYCDVNFSYVNFDELMPRQKIWEQKDGLWYLRDSAGNYLKGWQRIKERQYYLNDKGVMQSGWVQLANARYYFGAADDGSMKTGWAFVDGNWYYLNNVGIMQTGWRDIDGESYYLAPQTGAMVTGQQTIDGEIYQFSSSGALITQAASSQPQGAVRWVYDGGAWYLRDSIGANMTGWQRVSGCWYYLNASGAMATGWKQVGGAWYYLNPAGDMAIGWKLVDGAWYYLYGDGSMATGWVWLAGAWYYLNPAGDMATGWKLVDGVWYYLQSSGAMAVGWSLVDGRWYYLSNSGAMLANSWVGNYYVGDSGAMVTDAWVGNYYVDSSGLWDGVG